MSHIDNFFKDLRAHTTFFKMEGEASFVVEYTLHAHLKRTMSFNLDYGVRGRNRRCSTFLPHSLTRFHPHIDVDGGMGQHTTAMEDVTQVLGLCVPVCQKIFIGLTPTGFSGTQSVGPSSAPQRFSFSATSWDELLSTVLVNALQHDTFSYSNYMGCGAYCKEQVQRIVRAHPNIQSACAALISRDMLYDQVMEDRVEENADGRVRTRKM